MPSLINNVKFIFMFYATLGAKVVAEAACQVGVSGLQPNQEYVFAVAAYDRGGKLLAGGIGATSRPYLAAHSLPVDTALGYCCQVKDGKWVWHRWIYWG